MPPVDGGLTGDIGQGGENHLPPPARGGIEGGQNFRRDVIHHGEQIFSKNLKKFHLFVRFWASAVSYRMKATIR